jgi:uncharacterized protein with PQ loop repeat
VHQFGRYKIYLNIPNAKSYKNKLLTIKCRERIGDAFKLFDLFSLTQFFRYNQDEDYKTVSGGVTSILVVGIFIILFSGNAINTIDKTDITWSATTEHSFEPIPTTLSFSASNKFMVGLGILGFDLTDLSLRYFDVTMTEIKT